MPVTIEQFGTTSGGEPVESISLRNAGGLRVEVITLGAAVRAIDVPDRDGSFRNVALALGSVAEIEQRSPYLGATVGRFANRIAGARFALDGRCYELGANAPPHTLHGGFRGFDKALWRRLPGCEERASVTLTYISPHGEEGFPGRLEALARYTLTEAGDLCVTYRATTDAPTVVSLANHTYFNLGGEGSGSTLAHELWIGADLFTEVDDHLIPTGRLVPVAGTPFDFTKRSIIGARIDELQHQLACAGGYDHNFVVGRSAGGAPRHVATVRDPVSGRVLELRTNQPGLQFYSGNFLDGTLTGPSGRPYGRRDGLCLEPQSFPDAPNQPGFPSAVLRPGEEYRAVSSYSFRTA